MKISELDSHLQNDRSAEAENAVKVARGFVKDPGLRQELNERMGSALKGTVPKAWP